MRCIFKVAENFHTFCSHRMAQGDFVFCVFILEIGQFIDRNYDF